MTQIFMLKNDKICFNHKNLRQPRSIIPIKRTQNYPDLLPDSAG